MSGERIPDPILAAAQARSRARQAKDWPEADRLRGEIEAAGWKVIDRGTDFSLSPAHPPDVADGGRVRYGASASVPSRLDEAPVGLASVVLLATDWPADLERTVAGLREHAPDGTQVVVVGDGPSSEQDVALDALEARDPGAPGVGIEVVRTSARLGVAAATNAGIRRAASAVVVLLDTSVQPTGDVVTPLVAALADPSVAVAGAFGMVSEDLRQFDDAPAGDVDAVQAYVMAFRRADFVGRGPLDERFRFYRNLDVWWSLVLRDGGEGKRHRRAVAVDLPVARHEHRGWASVPAEERDRLSKRNFYRVLDRFGSRRDLLTGG